MQQVHAIKFHAESSKHYSWLLEDKAYYFKWLSDQIYETFKTFSEFCRIGESDEYQPFWYAVQDRAVENYTMKEVFSMDSSVRVEAIENLGMRLVIGLLNYD